MTTLAIVIGVRPHYIKAAAIRDVLQQHCPSIDTRFLDIAQHYDDALRGSLLQDLDLEVAIVREAAGERKPAENLGSGITAVGRWLSKHPDVRHVLVFGDADPALIGALAAHRSGVKVAHLEAGVRRARIELEHWTNVLVDLLSTLRLCTTVHDYNALISEGLGDSSHVVGDVCADWLINRANVVESAMRGHLLVSIHRPQNCSASSLEPMFAAITDLGLETRWIIHPRTKNLLKNAPPNVKTIGPLTHSETLALLKECELVITDSGGLVRESVLLERRCIVYHETGMWPGIVDSGHVGRCDPDIFSITTAIDLALSGPKPRGRSFFQQPNSSQKFCELVKSFIMSTSNDG